MKPLVLALPQNESLAAALAAGLNAEIGALTVRRFPDGESYVRLDTAVAGREVVLACTLDRPDDKVLALLFAAQVARELGARRVGLVAPYLAYMRQDIRFRPGECISARQFAALLSPAIDWLVTVDPHLHRVAALGEIYTVPTRVVHAAPTIAAWIAARERPLLIGPDSESEQWVGAIARAAGAPYVVLQKTRHGDREVEVATPDIARYRGHTPVLVDDIVSTARTMIATVGHIRAAGLPSPLCIGVHAVFADTAFADLVAAGAAEVVTCNTIAHASNRIDLSAAVTDAVAELLASRRGAD